MVEFLLQTTGRVPVEQVVEAVTSSSDVIARAAVAEAANGFELSLKSNPDESLGAAMLHRAGYRTLTETEAATNFVLAATVEAATTQEPSLEHFMTEGPYKGLIYAPSYTNYLPDNVTLNSQLLPEGNCEDVYVSENGMAYQVTVYCMYISIFVLALLGNGVVCYIVQSSPRMRTVTNYFIANLAIGDILMSLFCVPFSFISILIMGYWPFGVILCHLVNYSQAISVLVSAYTLVAISVDRYIVIMWPLRPRITKR